MDERRLDICFEGGGARGLALNGAVAELERRGLRPGRLVGTSAGAIAATFVAAGYDGAELRAASLERLPSGASVMTTFLRPPTHFTREEILDSTLGHILAAVLNPFLPDVIERPIEIGTLRAMLKIEPFAHLFSFVERGGLYSADGFMTWLAERLDAGGRGMSGLTLAELHAKTGKELALITSDTTAKRMLILNHRTAPKLPICHAVRMSMSIPFVWPEVIWDAAWGDYQGADIAGHAMMDGGLISNFALRLLVSDTPWICDIMGGPPDPEQRVLGLALDASLPVGAPAPRAPHFDVHFKTVARIERVFDTAVEGNDTTESDAYQQLVCDLPTGGYGTLEFDMSAPRIEALMDVAAGALDRWLSRRAGDAPSVHAARALLAASPLLPAHSGGPSTRTRELRTNAAESTHTRLGGIDMGER